MDRMQGFLDSAVGNGWRDILRPIRDGLDDIRDRLPGFTSETPEERKIRLAQRQRDALRGFAYFETFQELQEWDSEHVDPLQQSSIPLLERPHRANEEGQSESSKAKIMICHDFAGGYHPYESNGSNEVQDESFTLEYLQFIDIFIYFSHKLVAIPPPSWTNTLHRNGVLSLGTFIVENRIAGHNAILTSESHGDARRYPLAGKLAAMAIQYGFDGWLINIEQGFIASKWQLSAMLGFLQSLRRLLGPSRRLVWYDALDMDGKVNHQNALNASNSPYLEVCDDILINYKWTRDSLDLSLDVAAENAFESSRMYFGVDVWAQNKPVDKLHPRITYPAKDGGGTNTGIAVQECARQGVSSCIFGPAWCVEHFPRSPDMRAASAAMWQGSKMPKDVKCGCYPNQPDQQANNHNFNGNTAILSSAFEFAAGGRDFFWSDLQTAYSRRAVIDRDTQQVRGRLSAHIGSQSILPRPLSLDGKGESQPVWHNIDSEQGALTVGVTASDPKTAQDDLFVPLFSTYLQVPRSKAVELSIDFKRLQKSWTPLAYLRLSDETFVHLWLNHDEDTRKMTIPPNRADEKLYITEVGVMIHQPERCSMWSRLEVLQIYNISIMPRDIQAQDDFELIPLQHSDTPSVTNLRCSEEHVENDTYVRISWSLNAAAKHGPMDGYHHPKSEITGAMSHFEVTIDGEHVGRAYGLDMMLPESFMKKWQANREIKVLVDCVRFGGQKYMGQAVMLSKADADWEVV